MHFSAKVITPRRRSITHKLSILPLAQKAGGVKRSLVQISAVSTFKHSELIKGFRSSSRLSVFLGRVTTRRTSRLVSPSSRAVIVAGEIMQQLSRHLMRSFKSLNQAGANQQSPMLRLNWAQCYLNSRIIRKPWSNIIKPFQFTSPWEIALKPLTIRRTRQIFFGG